MPDSTTRRRPRTRRTLVLAGSGALLVAAVGIAYPILWGTRSLARGNDLLQRAATVAPRATSDCTAEADAAAATPSRPGVLEIPSVSATAPVLNGLSSGVLSAAVGHDPGTPWPGEPGESIVEAHDVSYFAGLSRLSKGSSITWLTSCFRAEFIVTGSEILKPGDALRPPTGASGLALVTCYPTNALFFTAQRFVVTARLVRESEGPQLVPTAPHPTPALRVDAPPALRKEGLTLASNTLALGTMALSGTPSKSFADGPSPLRAEASALTALFGAEHSVEAHNRSWWADIAAPSLSMPPNWPIFGTVDVTIEVSGSSVRSITFSSPSASAEVLVRDGALYLARLS